jgi:hypothetical protein
LERLWRLRHLRGRTGTALLLEVGKRIAAHRPRRLLLFDLTRTRCATTRAGLGTIAKELRLWAGERTKRGVKGCH